MTLILRSVFKCTCTLHMFFVQMYTCAVLEGLVGYHLHLHYVNIKAFLVC